MAKSTRKMKVEREILPDAMLSMGEADTSMQEISTFSGNNRFLSNFYPGSVTYEGLTYPTVEHAYQAAKTLDLKVREDISKMAKPSDVKRLGKRLVIRENWDTLKISVMKVLVYQKFMNHPDLLRMLFATGDQKLVEGNYWKDTFWGVCNGVGENHLGKILMEVRENLRKEQK